MRDAGQQMRSLMLNSGCQLKNQSGLRNPSEREGDVPFCCSVPADTPLVDHCTRVSGAYAADHDPCNASKLQRSDGQPAKCPRAPTANSTSPPRCVAEPDTEVVTGVEYGPLSGAADSRRSQCLRQLHGTELHLLASEGNAPSNAQNSGTSLQEPRLRDVLNYLVSRFDHSRNEVSTSPAPQQFSNEQVDSQSFTVSQNSTISSLTLTSSTTVHGTALPCQSSGHASHTHRVLGDR
jgi:hypothetical protein